MGPALGSNTVKVLLVEDDEVDSRAMKRAFEKHQIVNPLVVAKDGIQALHTLRGNGYEGLRRPYLILLDLNLPRMNGLEFLSELRRDEELSDSIVFVLTTSNDDNDRLRAYGHNVAGYLVKSEVGADFASAVSMLQHYWGVVEFP